jgi:subtilisin family serine protease
MSRIWLSAGLAVLFGLALAAGSGATRDPAEPQHGKRHVPGELIVAFRPGVTLARREEALAAAGLRQKRALTRDGRTALAVGNPNASEVALKRLGSDPRVAYAEPNFVVEALRTPNDPSFGQLWGLVNTGQNVGGSAGTADADIDADFAWDVSTGSSASVVGIIDTGVDFSHPDLAGTSWINSGENCTGCRTNGIDDDANGYVDDWRGWDFVNQDNNPFDDHGHGTHIAGTIAGMGNNGVGVAGINWTGRVAALKFLDWFGSGTMADAVRAVDYATQKGIRVTNNSWGGSEFSQALLDAIERAGAAGGLYVAAAGNDGADTDQAPMYPAAYASPAIISVAATDSRDGLASFSNRGRLSVDLGAPGVAIYSTLPGGTYDWWSGTSMATPHVAGAAALVKAARPGASSMAIKALLLRTVDAKASLASTTTGGRLNAGTAVRCSATPQLVVDEPVSGFQAIPGEPVRVVALAGVCGEPTATVQATANGVPFTLSHRGDGFYSGTYVPGGIGALTISVSASSGAASDTRSVSGTVAENYVFSDGAYGWIDATAGGTNTGLRSDDASVTLTLPFAFRFFGTDQTSVKVSTNGYLVFGTSDASAWSNVRLPSSAVPNGIVAPLWDDLRLNRRGAIWYRTLGTAPNRRFVVSWIGVPHYYDVGDSSFQAILEEGSGDIVFQYQDVDFGDEFVNDGASATVGVEDTAGAVGRTFSFDQASLGAYEGTKALRLSYHAGVQQPDVPGGNLLANGDFETSLAGWLSWQGVVHGAAGLESVQAAQVDHASGSAFSLYTRPRPVTATLTGQEFGAFGWVRTAARAATACLTIRERSASEAVLGSAEACVTTGASWLRFPALSYIARGDGSLELYVLLKGAQAGDTFTVDRLGLYRKPPADSTPPETTITAASASGDGASFEFTASEPSSFRCSLDGAAAASCTSPVAYSGLGPGYHRFVVYAVDGAGNADATASVHAWSTAGSGPNLLANGDFDTSLAGWLTWQGALSSGAGLDSPGAARVAHATGTAYSVYTKPRPVGSTTAGAAYTAAAWVKGTAGRTLCLNVRARAQDETVLATVERCLAATGDWQRLPTVSYTASAGSSLELFVIQKGAQPGDAFLVDHARLWG